VPVTTACWKRAAPQEAAGELRDRLQRICLAHRHYGYRRVRAALRKQGFVVNHKKVRRLMREDNLLAVRKRKWFVTTDSHHQLGVFPNLARFMEPDGADQLWVADLTYIRLRSEFSIWRWCWMRVTSRGGMGARARVHRQLA